MIQHKTYLMWLVKRALYCSMKVRPNPTKILIQSRRKVRSNQKRWSRTWNKFENRFETWKLNEIDESNKDPDAKYM